MKFAPAFLGLCLLLTACGQRDAAPPPASLGPVPFASDVELRKMLPGTWILERDSHATHWRGVSTVRTNGDYSEQVTITRSNETTVWRMEGTWQIKDGFLVSFVSRNDGYLPALEACLSCDRGPFPWLCRCGIRRSVW